jgi:ADP-heptose:LPS heptosyltransferase
MRPAHPQRASATDSSALRRVLVIKLSALGDFILSIASFQAIRRAHRDAEIVLLTTAPYETLARATGCFDDIWIDARPALSRPRTWLALSRRLRRGRFDRVYDLQRNDRTAWYFRLLGRDKPEWVGKAGGASHRYIEGPGEPRHITEREAEQLRLAGIERAPWPDLSFVDCDLKRFDLPARYAILVPGGAPHRPRKRWPADRYAELARYLAAQGVIPILVGTDAESDEIDAVAQACPEAMNLRGRTSLLELAALARDATVAVGNDTGPMHLVAASGVPVVSLFSGESDPRKIAPRGPHVTVLRHDDLTDLPVSEVLAALPADLRP